MTKKLLIAIPGKSIIPEQATTLISTAILGIPGWEVDYQITSKGTSIQMARDELAYYALEKGYSHILFIDSDIDFDREHIIKILSHNRCIVCGVYSRKVEGVMWEVVPTEPDGQPDENGLIQVDAAGAGFMLISTEIFKYMGATFPELLHKLPTGEQRCNFFYQGVVANGDWPDGRFLGEDHGFCYFVRRMGYSIWADTTILLPHIGNAVYPLGFFKRVTPTPGEVGHQPEGSQSPEPPQQP